MSAKHTPAPWVAVTYPTGYTYVVEQGNPDNDICRMSYAGDRGLEDARLIAAAPNLLAALKRAQYHIEGQEYLDAMAVIRAAISKTTGEQA